MSAGPLVVVPGDQGSAPKRRATESFLAALGRPCLCLEAGEAPYAPGPVGRLLQKGAIDGPVTVIAFSAGVVGVAAALGGFGFLQAPATRPRVRGLVAIDGWLVPLFFAFPVYRLSHDRFTHRTSRPFGMGRSNFWADPAVPHLEIWANPGAVAGWQEESDETRTATTALGFIETCLRDVPPYDGKQTD